MMKESIDWHKECLKNQKLDLDEKRATLERMTIGVEEDARSYNFYLAQILRAEKEGRNGFDRERFSIKKRVGDNEIN